MQFSPKPSCWPPWPAHHLPRPSLARLDLSSRARIALAMFSVGILSFLLVDVLGHGYEQAEAAVEAFGEDEGSLGHAAALTGLLSVASGSVASASGCSSEGSGPAPIACRRLPAQLPMRLRSRTPSSLPPRSTRRPDALFAPASSSPPRSASTTSPRVSPSASPPAPGRALATVLVIGFALHNATEGFGIRARSEASVPRGPGSGSRA